MKHLRRSLLLGLVLLLPASLQAQILPLSGGIAPPVLPYGTGPVGYGVGSALYSPFVDSSRGGIVLYPGFAAGRPVRARPELYPAIPLPTKEVIAAALYGAEKDPRAFLDVRVPTEEAQVLVDGVVSRQTGLTRRFVTPALKPGRSYVLRITVRWMSPYGYQSTSENVTVRAGDARRVDLRRYE